MPYKPGPNQGNETAQQAPKHQGGVSLRTEKKIYEMAPAGQQPAVLAEITAIQVEEEVRTGKNKGQKRMSDKIVLSFELAAQYVDPENQFCGKRVIITRDAYATFNDPKNTLVKLCLSWANKKSFTESEMKEWAGYLSAPMFLPDGSRNPESLVGSPCELLIVHGVGQVSGRPYAAIETVMPPRTDASGNLLSEYNLTISEDYTPYHERIANAERMRSERQAQQKDEFKGQF